MDKKPVSSPYPDIAAGQHSSLHMPWTYDGILSETARVVIYAKSFVRTHIKSPTGFIVRKDIDVLIANAAVNTRLPSETLRPDTVVPEKSRISTYPHKAE